MDMAGFNFGTRRAAVPAMLAWEAVGSWTRHLAAILAWARGIMIRMEICAVVMTVALEYRET